METKNIKYPYLPEGRNIFYVGTDNPFMIEAREIAKLSNDQQQPTGAVVVYDNKVISRAHNNSPLSNNFLINLHKKYCIRHILHIPSGEKYWLCPGCANKESHAEYKVAKQILRDGISGKPLDLYLWGHWWCCDVCWGNMLKVPIDKIFVLRDSDTLFNPRSENNILGHQFDKTS